MSGNLTRDAWDDYKEKKKAPEGYVGVRESFKKAGLDDSLLGWSDGNVTYKGITYKPDIVGDGITYGNQKGVNDFIRRAAEIDGDKVVRVNQYRPSSGLYDVSYNDATKEVLIGGKAVPYLYADADGNTWAKESVLKNAYSGIEKEHGIENPYETFSKYEKEKKDILDTIDDVSERKFEFSADDLENDVVWDAYENMYKREGQKAYEDAMAKVRARTGGNMSSMAQAAADQSYGYYLDKMTDAVPEIASQAYTRFQNDKAAELNALYGRENAIDDVLADEIAVRKEAYERRRTQQDDEKQRMYDKLSLDVAASDAGKQIAQNEYDVADMYNVPLSGSVAANYGVSPNADGTYPTPNQIFARKSQEIWDLFEKGVYDYKRAKELEDYARQQGIAMSNDIAAYKRKLELSEEYDY